MDHQPNIETIVLLIVGNYLLWNGGQKYLHILDPSRREIVMVHVFMYGFALEGMVTMQFMYFYIKLDRADHIEQMMIWFLSMLGYARLAFPLMEARDRRIKKYLRYIGYEEPYPPWYVEMNRSEVED